LITSRGERIVYVPLREGGGRGGEGRDGDRGEGGGKGGSMLRGELAKIRK